MSKWVYQADGFSPDEESCVLHETVFHNGNGYIGVRSNFEEGYPEGQKTIRGSYINGFYDFMKMPQAEKLCGFVEEKQTMVNVADTQTIRLKLGSEEFSLFEGTVLRFCRRLDMEKGVTERSMVWRSPEGKEVEITSRRMASFVKLPLFTMEYQVKSLNYSGEAEIISDHNGEVSNYCNPDDPRVAGESISHLRPVKAVVEGDVSCLVTAAAASGLLACSAVCHRLSVPAKETRETAGHRITRTYAFQMMAGETISMTKYTVFTDSVRRPDVLAWAMAEMSEAVEMGLEYWYQRQQEYLAEFWRCSDLDIDGDEETAVAVRYNLYQLLQSAGRDEFCNIAAKGLSGEGYEGHYFWDTEMYMQPFFTLTNPDISRRLLSFRYRTLDEARKNARIAGHESGALYPWRTIMGKECSGYFPSGTAAYHINGDIAYAVAAYYLVTEDREFLADMGAEILFETARLWIDAGNFHEGRFEIHEVTGPDEYTCLVDNNYYTNACAKYNLHWAVRSWEILKEEGTLGPVAEKIGLTDEEAALFRQAEEAMYLPYDEKLGINPQDETFLSKKIWDLDHTPRENFPLLLHYHPLYLYRHQVCKQADTVLAHVLFEDMQPRETMEKSFDYYEKITTHDSSLSTCIFSIMASRLGRREKAYSYFGDSAKLDLFNTHHNTGDGIHTANMGGVYMAVVYGFGGLKVKEQGLFLDPYLPEKWNAYRFQFVYLGSLISVEVNREGCRLTLLEGKPQTVTVYGKQCSLTGTAAFSMGEKKVPQYDAVIFDLDGVICHTDAYHYQAWKALADRLRVPFDEQVNNLLRGVSREESLEIILKHGGLTTLTDEEKRRACAEKNEIYKGLLDEMSPADLSAEVKDTLDGLRAMGIKLAIGSSSKNAKKILERIGLGGYFDAISDGTNITRSKPDPEVFLLAAQYAAADPERCLVVEDARAGIEAACRAGMDSAGIGDAAMYEKASYGIETFSQLLTICGKP